MNWVFTIILATSGSSTMSDITMDGFKSEQACREYALAQNDPSNAHKFINLDDKKFDIYKWRCDPVKAKGKGAEPFPEGTPR